MRRNRRRNKWSKRKFKANRVRKKRNNKMRNNSKRMMKKNNKIKVKVKKKKKKMKRKRKTKKSHLEIKAGISLRNNQLRRNHRSRNKILSLFPKRSQFQRLNPRNGNPPKIKQTLLKTLTPQSTYKINNKAHLRKPKKKMTSKT